MTEFKHWYAVGFCVGAIVLSIGVVGDLWVTLVGTGASIALSFAGAAMS